MANKQKMRNNGRQEGRNHPTVRGSMRSLSPDHKLKLKVREQSACQQNPPHQHTAAANKQLQESRRRQLFFKLSGLDTVQKTDNGGKGRTVLAQVLWYNKSAWICNMLLQIAFGGFWGFFSVLVPTLRWSYFYLTLQVMLVLLYFDMNIQILRMWCFTASSQQREKPRPPLTKPEESSASAPTVKTHKQPP